MQAQKRKFRKNHRYILKKVFELSENFQRDYQIAKEFHNFIEDRTICRLYDSQTPKLLTEAIGNFFLEKEENKDKWNNILTLHTRRFLPHHKQIIEFYATKTEFIRDILFESILLDITLTCIQKKI